MTDRQRPTSIRRLAIAGIAALVAFAILIGLGLWQLDRLAWKTALAAQIAERTRAEPVDVPAEPEWTTLDLGSWSYRRVRIEGAFDHGLESRVYVALSDAKGRFSGPGYFILTPLTRRDGSVVIVNRGFVPEGAANPVTRPEGQTPGQAGVFGLLREPEGRNAFTPADDPAKRLFFARDPATIAGALNLARAAPFTVDADATPNPGGLPQGGETRLDFPNRHFAYALTWFGLAAALAGVCLAYAIGALRRRRRGETA